MVSGIGLVSTLIGLEQELDAADLVITGEGSFDHQSLRGKVVAGIAGGARDRGLPCIVRLRAQRDRLPRGRLRRA